MSRDGAVVAQRIVEKVISEWNSFGHWFESGS